VSFINHIASAVLRGLSAIGYGCDATFKTSLLSYCISYSWYAFRSFKFCCCFLCGCMHVLCRRCTRRFSRPRFWWTSFGWQAKTSFDEIGKNEYAHYFRFLRPRSSGSISD